MKATTQAEGRNYYLNWELQKAAEKMLPDVQAAHDKVVAGLVAWEDGAF